MGNPACGQSPVQETLLRHAQEACLPYLLSLEGIRPLAGRVAAVLVGSVASGACDSDSDIDIALLVSDPTLSLLRSSGPEEWFRRSESGRPIEAEVGGRQLHWYIARIPAIRRSLMCHNDRDLYTYGTARPLWDPRRAFRRMLAQCGPQLEAVRRARLEGKLDMLIRRTRIVQAAVADGRLALGAVVLQVVTLGLKTVALIDGQPADPRKHLEAMALRGPLGARLRPTFLRVLGGLGLLGQARAIPPAAVERGLAAPLREICDALADAARQQGLRVGLPAPDPRHLEPQQRPADVWRRRSEWPTSPTTDGGSTRVRE